jgi:TonB family protein
MIRERFFQQWIQPQSVFTLDKKSVATVTIKIEKTGRISGVSLLKSSGNPVMDESVMDAARKVTQIEPLPSGMKQAVYEVDIDFELQ